MLKSKKVVVLSWFSVCTYFYYEKNDIMKFSLGATWHFLLQGGAVGFKLSKVVGLVLYQLLTLSLSSRYIAGDGTQLSSRHGGRLHSTGDGDSYIKTDEESYFMKTDEEDGDFYDHDLHLKITYLTAWN